MTTPCVIWKDRLCVVGEDGTWAMSAVGQWYNFDFFPPKVSPDDAVAGSMLVPTRADADESIPSVVTVSNICVVDDDHLLLIGSDGSIALMTGDPMKGGRLELLRGGG